MKRSVVLFFLIFGVLALSQITAAEKRLAHPSFEEIDQAAVDAAFKDLAPHPRLLLTPQKMKEVDEKIKKDPCWASYYEALKKTGDGLCKKPVLEFKKEGRRLLGVSREALLRLLTWGFLYQYTKDKSYADRAEKEMLALAVFPGWNPSHYLDVAEMTAAMAIGYDSFYNDLSEQSKKIIREAIVNFGIKTSMSKRPFWLTNTANWNQVCHCGICYGALAVAEEEPELARQIVQRSVNGVTWSMNSYEPDGNYTEGPGYWGYGTSFNILLIAGLKSALGTDFGRGSARGFLKSIHYYEHVFGTTGNAFNYPDSGGGKIFEPTVFWFTDRLKNPGLSWNENQLLQAALAAKNTDKTNKGPNGGKTKADNKADSKAGTKVKDFQKMTRSRLAVTALLWGAMNPASDPSDYLKRIKTIRPLHELGYVGIGNGLCPVVLLRTDWSPNGAYLGIKGGTPSSPHGHMDSGSFVYDNLGFRWAVDLGAENYNKIEQLGMDLWSSRQESDRWTIFRYNNRAHNTLTINNTDQLVRENAKILETKIARKNQAHLAVIDLSPVYKNEIRSAVRKAVLDPDGSLTITDEMIALDKKEAQVEWRLMTPAQVKSDNKKNATLTQSKKGESDPVSMRLSVQCPFPTEIKTESAGTQKSYDSKNPGITALIVSTKIPAGKQGSLKVTLVPVKSDNKKYGK